MQERKKSFFKNQTLSIESLLKKTRLFQEIDCNKCINKSRNMSYWDNLMKIKKESPGV